MAYKVFIRQCCIYFSGWSKKGYSIFSGLKYEVRISHLALHMYNNILLKSSSNGVIVNMDATAEEGTEAVELCHIPVNAGRIRGEVYPVIGFCGKNYR